MGTSTTPGRATGASSDGSPEENSAKKSAKSSAKSAEQSAKRRKTRAALIEAAHRVFSAQGLSGSTIDQITQAAGFTRGAFYSNFATREELMLAVMDRERERATARMSDYIAQVETEEHVSVEELTQALVEILAIGSADRDWQLALMEALPVSLRDPALAAHQLTIRSQAEDDAAHLLSLGLDRLGRTPTIELDLLVLQVLGVMDRILTDSLLRDTLDSYPDRVAKVLATLLLNGSQPITAP